MNLTIYLIVSIAICNYVLADIDNLSELYTAIVNGPNRKVGFLTEGNYGAVKSTLPSNVEVVIAGSTASLEAMVTDGTLIAGLLSGTPDPGFRTFSAGILSPQAMLLNNDKSANLLNAMNAAIVRVIAAGLPQLYARQNPPQTVIEVNTCKADANLFPFPPKSVVQDEEWYMRGSVHIASLGPYNWGYSGDYTANPPVGFWPSYLGAIESYFISEYNVNFTRSFSLSSDEVLTAVYNGTADATEPYFLLDDQFGSLSRTREFDSSCVVLGSDSTFFTKKSSSSGAVLSDGAYAGIVIGGVVLIASVIFLGLLIFKETRGEPLFMRLSDVDDDAKHSNNKNKQSNSSDIEIVAVSEVSPATVI